MCLSMCNFTVYFSLCDQVFLLYNSIYRYDNYHSTNRKGHYGQSYLESEVSTLDITDTPESLSQISAIAPVSDISNIQPSFVRSRHSKIAADTTWENAVSHARGEPDGAEKSFHRKKSKASVKVLVQNVIFY